MDQLRILQGTDVGPEEVASRFWADGYALVRDVLEVNLVESVRRQVEASLQQDGILDERARLTSSVSASFNEDSVPYRRASSAPLLELLPHASSLGHLVRGLIGPGCYWLPTRVLRLIPPAAVRTPYGRYAHQDFTYWRVNDMVTTWIPLMNIPVAVGGLALRPGSHRGPPVPLALLEDHQTGWATADFLVGDVLLFHCLSVHAALPNESPDLRMSVDFRWVPANERVSRLLVYGAGDALVHHPSTAHIPTTARLVTDLEAREANPAPQHFSADERWRVPNGEAAADPGCR